MADDYNSILRNAPDLRAAFRKLSKTIHPDTGFAEEERKKLCKARGLTMGTKEFEEAWKEYIKRDSYIAGYDAANEEFKRFKAAYDTLMGSSSRATQTENVDERTVAIILRNKTVAEEPNLIRYIEGEWDLQGLDFTDRILSTQKRPVDFTDKVLKGATLNRTKLDFAKFTTNVGFAHPTTKVDGASFKGAKFTGTGFVFPSVVKNVDFSEARVNAIIHNRFESCKFNAAKLFGTLHSPHFHDCELSGVDISRARIQGALKFSGNCNLHGMTINQTQLNHIPENLRANNMLKVATQSGVQEVHFDPNGKPRGSQQSSQRNTDTSGQRQRDADAQARQREQARNARQQEADKAGAGRSSRTDTGARNTSHNSSSHSSRSNAGQTSHTNTNTRSSSHASRATNSSRATSSARSASEHVHGSNKMGWVIAGAALVLGGVIAAISLNESPEPRRRRFAQPFPMPQSGDWQTRLQQPVGVAASSSLLQ